MLRVGFLGAGLIATYHSKRLRAGAAHCVRAGVFDPDPGRAERFAAAAGHHVCASEDEVIDGCDAVYVCTWTSEHPRQVAKAIEAGRHVFCEKPLAVDLAGAQAMTAAVGEAGVTNMVGLVLRRSPAFVLARALIADPAAGPVMSVVFRDDQFIPIQGHYDSTWRADRDRVGAGTLLEHSIHDVDLLRFLIGEVDTVSTMTANHHGHDGIEDVATATLRFQGGALGTLTSVWHDNLARPSLRRVEVFCARRHVVVTGDDWDGPVRWTDADGTTGSRHGPPLADAAAALLGGDGPNADAAFVAAASVGATVQPDFATALAAHRIVAAMYESAAAGGAPCQVGAPITAG